MLEHARASYHLKSASSTLGLLGGDLGEPPVGVFLQVEERDIMAEEMGETLDQSQMRTGSRDQVSTNEGSPGGGAGGLLPRRLLQHPDVVLVQERHRGHPVGGARDRRRGVRRGEVPG